MSACRVTAGSPTPKTAEPNTGSLVPVGAAAELVAVATSGGRDSTALLHATARAARDTGQLRVVALHVHHGLQPQADEWAKSLGRKVKRWQASGLPVEFAWRKLQGAPSPGASVEAWARHGRYLALADMAKALGASLVLLAHHQDDQAETFLIQALRGGGPAGLAAMPRTFKRHGVQWARPWLTSPASAIGCYVRAHQLSFVSDPSNLDPRFARSRLRNAVMPMLAAQFPHSIADIASSAKRCAEAAQCLDELAQLDAQLLWQADGSLSRAQWYKLSAARRALGLRHWLQAHGAGNAPNSLISRLLDELPCARSGATWPCGGYKLRADKAALRLESTRVAAPLLPLSSQPITLDLSRPGRYGAHPWQGQFVVAMAQGMGLEPQALKAVQLDGRRSAVSFQAAPHATPRSLKKQFQSAQTPAQERGGPYLYGPNGDLLFAPALGIDARWLRAPAERLLYIQWEPADAAVQQWPDTMLG